MIEFNKIYNEDCLSGMKKISDNTVNCIITSPPYNVGLDYDEYKDNKPYYDYLSWIKDIFTESYRVLAEDGRMCINIGDGKNGSIPTHSDFIQIAKEIGFHILTIIIWNKNTTSNRTAWGSFMSPSCPSFPRCFEYILVFSKTHKLSHKGISTIEKKEFIEWSNGMWSFNCESLKKIGHPAAFPVELPTRCIKLFTYEGDVVLDPFIGSGTTAVACIRENRKFIGFETSDEYFKLSNNRIKVEQGEFENKLF